MSKKRKPQVLKAERLLALRELGTRLDLAVDDEQLALLNQALTTAAWTRHHGGHNNEWLEWYGDAIWSHAAIELTLETFPCESRLLIHEGWRMRLKSGDRQTRLAYELGLNALLLLPPEYKPIRHGKKLETKEVLTGSSLEALIGGIATWSVREAIRVAKGLMLPLLPKLPLTTADYIQSTDHDRGLDISSCEQLLGYTRLSLFITRTIMDEEAELTLKGAWLVRHQVLSVRTLGLLGRRANVADDNHSDSQAMQRLLAHAGKGAKLNPVFKQALADLLAETIKSVKDSHAYRGPQIQAADRNPVGELKTLLNGHAPLTFESRFYGGGQKRVILTRCFVNGQAIGEGIDRDGRIAKQRAAEAALNNPALQKVYRGESH